MEEGAYCGVCKQGFASRNYLTVHYATDAHKNALANADAAAQLRANRRPNALAPLQLRPDVDMGHPEYEDPQGGEDDPVPDDDVGLDGPEDLVLIEDHLQLPALLPPPPPPVIPQPDAYANMDESLADFHTRLSNTANSVGNQMWLAHQLERLLSSENPTAVFLGYWKIKHNISDTAFNELVTGTQLLLLESQDSISTLMDLAVDSTAMSTVETFLNVESSVHSTPIDLEDDEPDIGELDRKAQRAKRKNCRRRARARRSQARQERLDDLNALLDRFPHSADVLRRLAADDLIDFRPAQLLVRDNTGQELYLPYFEITDYIRGFLANPELVRHLVTTSRYRRGEYTDYTSAEDFKTLCSITPSNDLPLAYRIEADGTEVNGKELCLIYFTIANVLPEMQGKRQFRKLVTAVPKHVSVHQVVPRIVEELQNLTPAYRLPFNQDGFRPRMRNPAFYNGLLEETVRVQFHFAMMCMDIVGASDFLGLRGHNATCPCRHCLALRPSLWPPADLGDQDPPGRLPNPAPTRRAEEMKRHLEQQVPRYFAQGTKMAADRELQKYGLQPDFMPAWLNLHSVEIYLKTPYCYLHQILLGMVSILVGRFRTREGFRRRVHGYEEQSFITKFDTIMRRLASESRFVGSIRSVSKSDSWTGNECSTFAGVCVVVMCEILNDDNERRLWRYIGEYVDYLGRARLYDADLTRITELHHLIRSTLRQIFDIEEDANVNLFGGLNWHVGEHWAQSIRQFGVPYTFSTSYSESKHQDVKGRAATVNNTNDSWDISMRENRYQAYFLEFGDFSSLHRILSQRLRTLQGKRLLEPHEEKVERIQNRVCLLNEGRVRDFSAVERVALSESPVISASAWYQLSPTRRKFKSFNTLRLRSGAKVRSGDYVSFRLDDAVSYGKVISIGYAYAHAADQVPPIGLVFLQRLRRTGTDDDPRSGTCTGLPRLQDDGTLIAVPAVSIVREYHVASCSFRNTQSLLLNIYYRSETEKWLLLQQ
eukprot:TRINITY_DN2249_c0_g3_i1.p1 TRINITY_DN2249_c0_g3~~TRINITY_DN2249_c0_g3_i1.p1  ORF type:complete len:1055 (+),score=109.80 TRINITY_DN2249_c0_g3_i1:181-3165(+)